MQVLSFHLCGKMAHFRRYYTNSSALSYSIPPRTTLSGIIAGLLGYEKDQYYDDFSLNSCDIAISVRQPLKKSVQTMNLLKIERLDQLNGSSGVPSQTATEFVLPYDIRRNYLDYKVWFHHHDASLMNELTTLLNKAGPVYGTKGATMALGTVFNLGWISGFKKVEATQVNEKSAIVIDSVIPMSSLKKLTLDEINEHRLVREKIPLEFDSQRRITARGLGNVIIDLNGKGIPAIIDSYVQLESGERIMWMA
jgi:CRISPR-associated protein Cas5h